ncbi:MAG: hypothetical protein JO339_31960 [Alphaproteobacteria bacterium]|nr:hypothetical protein [Alphaproteobacteria bacterium]
MIRFGRPAAAALAILSPALAAAQDVSVEFRLVAAPGNITGCIAADPQFTRVHTFTVKDGAAELTAPGGINSRMKLEKPGVYETDYRLGQFNLHVVADLNSRMLTVTDRNLGCTWTAKKE